MNLIQKVEHWGDTHHPRWLDILRMILGVLLFFKGVEFINNMNTLSALMGRSHFLGSMSLGVMGHYIIMAHLIGGFMVAFGLLTRVACLFQLPILLGAVIFVNAPAGVIPIDSSWWLSLAILLGLVFFLIEGGGPWSADKLLKNHPMKITNPPIRRDE
jgi:putative oxidoreductase